MLQRDLGREKGRVRLEGMGEGLGQRSVIKMKYMMIPKLSLKLSAAVFEMFCYSGDLFSKAKSLQSK